jgi:hypothetical protein
MTDLRQYAPNVANNIDAKKTLQVILPALDNIKKLKNMTSNTEVADKITELDSAYAHLKRIAETFKIPDLDKILSDLKAGKLNEETAKKDLTEYLRDKSIALMSQGLPSFDKKQEANMLIQELNKVQSGLGDKMFDTLNKAADDAILTHSSLNDLASKPIELAVKNPYGVILRGAAQLGNIGGLAIHGAKKMTMQVGGKAISYAPDALVELANKHKNTELAARLTSIAKETNESRRRALMFALMQTPMYQKTIGDDK